VNCDDPVGGVAKAGSRGRHTVFSGPAGIVAANDSEA
jgi:hypothetical protein